MGFFDFLFANRKTKQELIRELVKERVRHDALFQNLGLSPEFVDGESDDVLQGTPEATVVWLVENFAALKSHGVPDEMIFQLLEDQRAVFSGSGEIPSPLDLETYTKYRIAHENVAGAPISSLSIERALREAKMFFGIR